jgi:hypothetical protein
MSTLGEKTTAFKSGAGKFIKRLIAIIVLLGIAVMLFIYYGTYSEGVRAGVVLKVSKKGALFKTYEGQLDLLSFGAVKSSNQLSQTFEFSIYKDDFRTIQKLEEVALSGARINLRYEEKYAALPWRGDTKYFAVGVEEIEGARKKDPSNKSFPD